MAELEGKEACAEGKEEARAEGEGPQAAGELAAAAKENGRRPEEIYKELGPTALFLRTTTARKAAVLAASKAAKEAEEENARLAALQRARHRQSILQEASLHGRFRMQPTLPPLQSGRSEWAGFLRRGSVLGLSFKDLLETAADVEEAALDNAGGGESKRGETESKRGEEEGKSAGESVAGDAFDKRLARLNARLLRSKKKTLSYDELLKKVLKYDSDYRPLFPRLTNKQLQQRISEHRAPRRNGVDPNNKPVFDSDRALLVRERLKRSDRIRALVTLFWLACDVNANNSVSRSEYIDLNRRLQIAIMGLDDPGLGFELAARDWELDKDPATGTLPFETLFCSLFMLTDMYAEELSEDSYCDFLSTIAQRIMRLDPRSPTPRLVYRTDANIITRKTFEFIQAEHPRWTAFELPETSRACRKLYGSSSLQVEDLTYQSECDEAKGGDSGLDDEDDSLERESTLIIGGGEVAEDAKPLARDVSRSLDQRRQRRRRRREKMEQRAQEEGQQRRQGSQSSGLP